MKRRNFLTTLGAVSLAPSVSLPRYLETNLPIIIKPRKLKPGETIALVSPASAIVDREEVEISQENISALGFKPKLASHLLERRGYLAGDDKMRAADINAQFADPSVAGIMAMRGGWGCARVLPLLDYDLINKNPKVLIGYSDVTSLLLAIFARTGLVTFHGPIALDPWHSFSVDYFKRLLLEGETPLMSNPTEIGDHLTQLEDRVQTINQGRTSGPLAGGCLTIISSLLGSSYLPDWRGTVLFVEDVHEDIYRVDRMLTQLKLTGVLSQIKGFIFGRCTECEPGEGYGSLTLEQVFDDHIRPLGIPAWYGSMIGHIPKKFTVPIGIRAEIDAEKGTIQLLEPAVV